MRQRFTIHKVNVFCVIHMTLNFSTSCYKCSLLFKSHGEISHQASWWD